jgi:hypothetical protein
MFVCCVLSGRGLCDELITRLEESYRPWRFVVFDHENLMDDDVIARTGLQSKKKLYYRTLKAFAGGAAYFEFLKF